MNDELITREGYEQLKADIEHIESVERIEIAKEIAKARAYGDLSENFEYHSAKEAQAQLEARLAQLRHRLKIAKVVEEDAISGDTINLGHHVTLKDEDSGRKIEYHIVGHGEANIAEGKISIQSPVGEGLFGRKVGDTVTIEAPSKTIKLKVLGIK
jgi:transcription elongation factor GreA